ncbi:LPXTG cell wall anchor domain-containing protein [Vagococcus carniphilus]|uniref:LPXTG cell wall anchor domain-containing protein n=1 Tax=Vagococcus carniphilus TaxID=218144 RepID=UPI0028919111|nr:LPXTG cell wall anchor domain-containing protein [Vagococcus carniphilus]MDT2848874.1 LPXTG cell wall anchor domain-containing protein [Vagococcus carniphilus]
MEKKIKLRRKTLLLLVFLLGMTVFSVTTLADKKATEGQNEADVEFYEPTPGKIKPPKPEPKKPAPKKIYPVAKILPKTGEEESPFLMTLIGICLLGSVIWFVLQRKKAGGLNEN